MSAPNPPAKTNSPTPPTSSGPTVAPAAAVVPGAVDTSALAKALAKSTIGNQANTVTHVDSIPSNWEISSTSDPDIIQATNRVSGSTFEGVRKDFSKFIAGKLVTEQVAA